jgi:flagellar biogenesis protein FliO
MDGTQSALGALLTLVLLGGVLWWLRQKGMAAFAWGPPQGAKTRRMRTLERLALTPQHSLHLVEVQGRTVLIAASPGGCSILEGGAPVPDGGNER